MLTLDKVYHAAYVLKPVIRKTDLIPARQINPESEIYLKTENLQVTGSFKVRGAYYKISQLSDEEKAHGVIACSAGNHAQGVALAAAHSGIPSPVSYTHLTNARLMSWLLSWLMLLCVMISFISKNSYTPKFIF